MLCLRLLEGSHTRGYPRFSLSSSHRCLGNHGAHPSLTIWPNQPHPTRRHANLSIILTRLASHTHGDHRSCTAVVSSRQLEAVWGCLSCVCFDVIWVLGTQLYPLPFQPTRSTNTATRPAPTQTHPQANASLRSAIPGSKRKQNGSLLLSSPPRAKVQTKRTKKGPTALSSLHSI